MIRKLFIHSASFRRQILLVSQCHFTSSQFVRLQSTTISASSSTFASSQTFTTVAPSKLPTVVSDDTDNREANTVAYNERERTKLKPSKHLLIEVIKLKLGCDDNRAIEIFNTPPDLRNENVKKLVEIVEYLLDNGINGDSILANPWLISSNLKAIKAKVPLLQLMRPRNINDLVPLMCASVMRMQGMKKLAIDEASYIPGGNRVYLLSDTLQLEPKLVAKCMSQRLFMFHITYENLMGNLDLFVKYKVAPMDILRDLWAFRYSPGLIEYRLGRAAGGQKDKLMPWMVRCPESILDKSIQNTLDEKEVLGDNDVVEYISNRIGYDVATTKFILQKHLPIYNVRVTKIRVILDYLLDEAEFSKDQIANVPRILCHRLETTKKRVEELKGHGCKPSSLVVLCKSQKEFQKFLTRWLNVREKMTIRNMLHKN